MHPVVRQGQAAEAFPADLDYQEDLADLAAAACRAAQDARIAGLKQDGRVRTTGCLRSGVVASQLGTRHRARSATNAWLRNGHQLPQPQAHGSRE